MSKDSGADSRGYEADHSLQGIYGLADKLDGEGLEMLCPGYADLAAVEDRYTDEQLIGEGGLKDVFRCFDHRTKRFVALARPRAKLGVDCFDDFVSEAWLVSSLKHPNIIKVHDAGVDADGRPFFTMDLKGNTTLKDLVKQSTDGRELLVIFLKICDAIAYAHSEGIIHRDLKPENIQCDSFGEVLVCDWGLGKFLEAEDSKVAGVSQEWNASQYDTLNGEIKGSLGYMAPEQILPEEEADERSDVFALGCLLHFILAGSAPFSGTKDEILEKTTGPQRQSLRSAFPGRNITKSMEAVTLKAIARDPAKRYGSVTELQADINRHLAGRSTGAERPSLFRRGALFINRNRTPFAVAAGALVILGISAAVFMRHLQNKELDAERARAASLLLSSDFDDLSADYETLVTETEEPLRELSDKLVNEALVIKRRSIFTTPKVDFRRANRLINKAIELNPDSYRAKLQRASLQGLMLNYAETVKEPSNPEREKIGFIKIARAFPDYNFNERRRPSIDELVGFFRRAKEIDGGNEAMVTAILAFDAETRRDKSHFPAAVGAALEYLWPAEADVKTEYLPQLDQLSIKSAKGDFTGMRRSRSSALMMPFLKVDTLVLEVGGRFDLSSLQHAAVRRLDISKVKRPFLPKDLVIKGLEEVVVSKRQARLKLLERLRPKDDLTLLKVTVVREK